VLLYITQGLTCIRTFQLAAYITQISETNCFSDGHRIIPLNNLITYYRIYKISPPSRIMNQKNPLHKYIYFFIQIHINIIVP
jgi:hypothetical protein